MRLSCLCSFAAVISACGSGATDADQKAKAADKPRQIAGVWPDKFQCDTVAAPTAISQILGGTARQVENPMSVGAGIAKPCAYEVTFAQPAPVEPVGRSDAGVVGRAPEYWTFDFDCRANMKQTADALFAQYQQTNSDRIEAYNTATDAGILPGKPDANIPMHKPGAAHEVDVGAKGLDHNDQAILFLDDDAPCYVRVNGPDGARRLELARAVAKGLTFVNAPMEPRSLP